MKNLLADRGWNKIKPMGSLNAKNMSMLSNLAVQAVLKDWIEEDNP